MTLTEKDHSSALAEGLSDITRLGGTASADIRIAGPQDITGQVRVANLLANTVHADVPVRAPSVTIRLDRGRLAIPQTTAYLGSSALRVGGTADLRADTYRFQIQGSNVNLETFYNEVLVNFAQARDAMAHLSRLEGRAAINLTVASGEPFDMHELSAAHRTLPLVAGGTYTLD